MLFTGASKRSSFIGRPLPPPFFLFLYFFGRVVARWCARGVFTGWWCCVGWRVCWLPIDQVDERLMIELGVNARLSYTTLAQDLGMTVNAVKKRVAKLMEQGVLVGFDVVINAGLCYGGQPVDLVFGWVSTNGSEEEEELIQQLGSFPSINLVAKTTQDTYGFRAMVSGFEGVSELTQFLEMLQGVTEIHTDVVLHLGRPKGLVGPKFSTPQYIYEYTFSKSDLLVLRSLREDPRMSISKIAKQTGLTAKRVRKILGMFHETRVAVVHANFNLGAAGFMSAYLRVKLDLNVLSPEEFRDWAFTQFPWEWLGTFSRVDSPSTIIQLIAAEHISRIEEITKQVKSAPAVQTVETIVLYSGQEFPGKMHHRVDELLEDAGL